MRLLDPRSLIDIPQLGLRPDLFKIIEEELARPNGMLLTTGPTGSGKTTLLYASLRRVATREVKVITIEDPIEYKLEGIEQTQIDAAEGYTFAVGLRSIVRQDPDIILVGEIRDNETADIALQAALTGHLVFSTLHTNDAAGAVPRLIELGSHAEAIAPSINVVMAQRLVRRACDNCRSTYTASDELLEKLRIATSRMPSALAPNLTSAPTFLHVKGCNVCRGTGYTGRIGIFELFRIDDAAEELIAKHPTTAEVREHAIANGMVTLQQDALLHALNQVTTIEDVIRVTGPLRAPHDEHGEDLIESTTPRKSKDVEHSGSE